MRAEGEVDVASAPALLDRVSAQAATRPVVVLDVRLVTFLDARGARVLVDADRAARSRGSRMVVAGLGTMPRRVVRICDALPNLTVREIPADPASSRAELTEPELRALLGDLHPASAAPTRRRGNVVAALARLAEVSPDRCAVCGAKIGPRRPCHRPDADRCLRHEGAG